MASAKQLDARTAYGTSAADYKRWIRPESMSKWARLSFEHLLAPSPLSAVEHDVIGYMAFTHGKDLGHGYAAVIVYGTLINTHGWDEKRWRVFVSPFEVNRGGRQSWWNAERMNAANQAYMTGCFDEEKSDEKLLVLKEIALALKHLVAQGDKKEVAAEVASIVAALPAAAAAPAAAAK